MVKTVKVTLIGGVEKEYRFNTRTTLKDEIVYRSNSGREVRIPKDKILVLEESPG